MTGTAGSTTSTDQTPFSQPTDHVPYPDLLVDGRRCQQAPLNLKSGKLALPGPLFVLVDLRILAHET